MSDGRTIYWSPTEKAFLSNGTIVYPESEDILEGNIHLAITNLPPDRATFSYGLSTIKIRECPVSISKEEYPELSYRGAMSTFFSTGTVIYNGYRYIREADQSVKITKIE